MKHKAWMKQVRNPRNPETVLWIADNETAIARFHETYFDEDGALRWLSNDSVPPQDCLEQWHEIGLLSDEEFSHSDIIREHESSEAIRQYVEYREKHGYSDEELFEMRAAFGDEPVVDVFTGKKVSPWG